MRLLTIAESQSHKDIRLFKLHQELVKMECRFVVGLFFFLLTLDWLFLYRIFVNLIIVAIPTLTFYCVLYRYWARKYKLLKEEHHKLMREAALQNQRTQTPAQAFFYFKRN